MDEMLSTALPRQRAAHALPTCAEPTAGKSSPCLERCALQSLWLFAAEELLDNEEKHFSSPESLTVPFQTIQHKVRDILLTQQHQCLKETVGNVKFMVLWVIGGRFLPPLQQASVKNRASRKFLATSQQSRRKLYPTLPLGLNEIYSLWASFNLVFQIAKPVKEGS